jgi:ATP-dependent Lhr-like helicase
VERWARLLLRRYGVVFRALLDRENAPPWRDLLREYRRLEARGEVRGGRFVQRHAGEQFALPEAIPLLRSLRRSEPSGQEVCLSACDPLYLLGTLVPGERVPASPSNFLLFRDGLPIAALEAGRLRPIEAIEESARARVLARLRRGTLPSTGSDAPAGLGPRRRSMPAPGSSERAQASS